MSDTTCQVLLIDDAEVEHLWLERMIRRIDRANYRLDWLADYAAAMAAMEADLHDLYFVDFRLGRESGLDLIRHARQRGVIKPIIMLTSHGNTSVDLAAMEAGANDYLVKGEFDVVLLDRVMRYATRQAQTLAELAQRVAEQQAILAHLVQLIEAAPTAMLMCDDAGQIELVNEQTERLFGHPRADMIGTSVDLLLPARFRPAHHRLRSGFFTENTARPATGRQMGAGRTLFGLRKNGSEVEVEVRLSPIRTGEGMKVLAAIVDVTDRVRREASTRQSQQLHAIGRVTAGVAHDFNNLLTVLSGSVELLLDAVPDRPEALAWGQSALRAITRGRELTDRLLSFARKQVLNPQPIPITVLFSELQALLGHLFEVNTVARTELVITPGAPGLSVLADHAQLEAALINLAVNARDAMANGGCLRISARQAFADPAVIAAGTYTVISVVDTGKGMDAATLAQACEPFFTTKGTAGTGLGLSMVQGFARQSGGEAIISSVVGQGTTIDLWLPAAGAPSAIEPPRPGAAPAPAAGRILLVDDNADALTVLSAFLRAAGHDVTIRDNAERALADLTAGQRFDAMVTDFAMPGMNGRELLTRARRIDPSMPGLMITGFTDPDILADLKGVVVLRKPFSRVDLTTTVRRIIEAARAAATS